MRVRRFVWIVVVAFGMILSEIVAVAAEEALYDPRGRRDPFVPLVTATTRTSSGLVGVESLDELTIEGIVYDAKGSVVILNGTVLREGEELGMVKVVKISENGALFSINGVEAFKSLYEDNQKKGNA